MWRAISARPSALREVAATSWKEKLITSMAELFGPDVSAAYRCVQSGRAHELVFHATLTLTHKVGCCKLKLIETCVESVWFQRWILTYDKLLSSFNFKFNLRHCNKGYESTASFEGEKTPTKKVAEQSAAERGVHALNMAGGPDDLFAPLPALARPLVTRVTSWKPSATTVKVGPGRYCPPRHRMPCDSRNKGS